MDPPKRVTQLVGQHGGGWAWVGEDVAAHPTRVSWMPRAVMARTGRCPDGLASPGGGRAGLARRDAVHRFGGYSVV
jgi:hypothetical protein